MYDALTAAGVSAQLIPVVGGGHGFYTGVISPTNAQIVQMMANFLDSKLKTP
jgi:acetyl esterase/lipase